MKFSVKQVVALFFLLVFVLLGVDMFTQITIFGFKEKFSPLLIFVTWAVVGNTVFLLIGGYSDGD